VYALMMSVNRSLTPGQLDAALFSSTIDLGSFGKDGYFGYGRVDAQAAVAKVRTTSTPDSSAPVVSISSPLPGDRVSGIVAVDVKASDDREVTRVELFVNGVLIGSDATAPYGFSVDTSGMPEGDLAVEARGVDAAGNVGKANLSVIVANDTTPPSVQIVNPLSGATITGPTTVSVSASDDKRVAKIKLAIGGKEVANSYGSTLSYTWDPYAGAKGKGNRSKVAGTYTITATATDDAGNARSASVSVKVQ
jgi:thermitase